jgi:hypothetical protein
VVGCARALDGRFGWDFDVGCAFDRLVARFVFAALRR